MPKIHAIPESDLEVVREFLLDLPFRMFAKGGKAARVGRIVDLVAGTAVNLPPSMERAVLVHMGHQVEPEPEPKQPEPEPEPKAE